MQGCDLTVHTKEFIYIYLINMIKQSIVIRIKSAKILLHFYVNINIIPLILVRTVILLPYSGTHWQLYC